MLTLMHMYQLFLLVLETTDLLWAEAITNDSWASIKTAEDK